jgi:hypothetical protein
MLPLCLQIAEEEYRAHTQALLSACRCGMCGGLYAVAVYVMSTQQLHSTVCAAVLVHADR